MAETNNNKNNEVIDLLMSDNDDDDDQDNVSINDAKNKQQKQRRVMKDPPPSASSSASSSGATNNKTEGENKKNGISNRKNNNSKINNSNKYRTTAKTTMAATKAKSKTKKTTSDGLQAGLVLEEDVFASSAAAAAVRGNEGEDYHSNDNDNINNNNNNNNNTYFELFEDDEFGPVASSIMGIHKPSIVDINLDDDEDEDDTDEDDVKVESSSSSSASNKKKTTQNDNSNSNSNNNNNKWNPKCRCKMLARLSYKEKDGAPYFECGKVTSTKNNPKNNPKSKCKFFTYAFKPELTVWYRFGHHNRHVLVQQQQQQQQLQTLPSSLLLPSNTNNNNSNDNSNSLFSAQDLVQGTVGDCWFLSALAVVAERPDLIRRLFQQQLQQHSSSSSSDDLRNGIIRVNLFLDGIWSQVQMDNFLPCYIRGYDEDDDALQKALEASLLSMNGGDNENSNNNNNNSTILRNPYKKNKNPNNNIQQYTKFPPASSRNDPNGLSERNRQIMIKTTEFIDRDRKMKQQHRGGGGFYRPRLIGFGNASRGSSAQAQSQSQVVQTRDLAYSKAHKNQLWVPFLEKAYAKIHGSYQAISGGQIAEAFLDLTGAPTLQIGWHAGRAASGMNSTSYDDPKRLWFDLLKWRKQRLPMGCGTDSSSEGLVGMHAYSILDIREITDVGIDFFKDHLIRGTLGNVSGFTEYDGKVRLLRIRNPHGQGEWKGEFSDKCAMWEQLLTNSGITLPRSGINDGTFWIGYDDFLLGFSNIDVVLAHQGNHAKSFISNFPQKINNHRCTRAFEVSLIDPQPGLETKERVEVYVMGIQKSKRGARQGRKDRKKSYKVSDMGMLVGEYPLNSNGGSENNNDNDDGADANSVPFSSVHGQMFGFKRNGHYKIVLDRKKCKRLVVMPISFGHPAATDALLSFVVRFNADAPLMIRELEEVPRMDRALCDFLIRPKPSGHFSDTRQGQKKILWQNPHYRVVQINCFGNRGGTVFVYLCASPSAEDPVLLGVEATCRGMSCRVEAGLLDHETLAKGKKFEAAWRKFKCDIIGQTKSQLLMVLYQSGQDTEMGSIIVKPVYTLGNGSNTRPKPKMASTTLDRYWKTNTTGNGDSANNEEDTYEYKLQGVFNPIRIDDDTFLHCGVNREVFESSSRAISMSGQGQYHPDGELLDGDAELQQALALSRQGHGVPDDSKDLEEALKRSCQDKEGRGTTTEDIDMELEDALRRSREDDFGRNQGSSLKQTIDLTMKKAAKSKKNDNAIVLDLTDTSDNPTYLTIDGSINNSKENPDRRGNNCEEGDDQEIIILDSDEEDSSDTKAEYEEKGKRKDIVEPSSSSQNREKKRKLAAEAALKRLEGRL